MAKNADIFNNMMCSKCYLKLTAVILLSTLVSCSKDLSGTFGDSSTADVIYTSDTFNEMAGAFAIPASTDFRLGGTQQPYATIYGTMAYTGNNTITSTAVSLVSSTSSGLVDAGTSECETLVTVVTQTADGGIGIEGASNTTDNKYLLINNVALGTYVLIEIEPGPAVNIRNSGGTAANGDVLKLGVSGTRITATITSSGGSITNISYTDSSPRTGTHFGPVFAKNGGAEPDGEIGSFKIQNCE